jgi:orotate phosphoribosyltransferase
LIRPGVKILLVEDLVSTGSTLSLLINLVEDLGGLVVGIGCLWRRTSVEFNDRPVFSLVRRDFPTYDTDKCPLCKRGVPLNEEFVRRRHARRPSSVQEPKEA